MTDDLFGKIKGLIKDTKAPEGDVGPPAPPAVGAPSAPGPGVPFSPPPLDLLDDLDDDLEPPKPPPGLRAAIMKPVQSPPAAPGTPAHKELEAPLAPPGAPSESLRALVSSPSPTPKGVPTVPTNDGLPSNATLDDLIAFAKARTGSGKQAPPEVAPAPQGLPSLDDDLPEPEMNFSPNVLGAGSIRGGALPDVGGLPDIDDELARPILDPGVDVDRILAEKKAKDSQSVQRLLTTDYLPPAPRTPAETGLEPAFLGELIIKTGYFATELEGLRIAEELCLPFNAVIEPLIRQLKDEQYIEIRGGRSSMAAQWRFVITSKGIEKAHEILQKNGYYGPAPVSVSEYTEMVHRQRLAPDVTLTEVKAAFHDLVLSADVLEKIGPAVNSAKSAFLYGPPGNGKTSIAERMCNLLGGAIFIPHAIEVGGQVVKIFDAYIHNAPSELQNLDLSGTEMARMDRRWVICRRPIVIVGGELTLEMLDLTYNQGAKFYEAPFQVKSNGGMLLIDDFGRQKVRPRDLLNRWIVPLEKQVDFLTLHTGRKVELPFDQFIVFSTNLNPADLVDEAFLRRLRYKIEIEDPSVEEYIEIFKRFCKMREIKYQSSMMKYLLENYYLKEGVNFRACHPRDLLDQIIDRARYRRIKPQLTPELIDHAWKSYFVKL